MADEPSSSAGARFSEDLRRIREERGISIQEIHQNTQIAETLIESFEEARLYDHPTYNRVYLRSFIRAYADAIGISQEQALDHLDAALEGTYEHALADEYLADSADPAASTRPSRTSGDEEGAPSNDETAAPTAGGPEGRGGIVGPPRAIGEDKEDDAGSSAEQSPSPSGMESSPSPQAPDHDQSESDPEEQNDSRVRESGADPNPEDEEREPGRSSSTPSPPDAVPSWKEEGVHASDSQASAPSVGDSETGAIPSKKDTGVVGEPTALGSEEPSPPSEAAPAGEPSGEAGGPPTGGSTSKPFFFGDQPRIYAIGVGIAVVVAVLIGLGVAYFSAGSSSQQTVVEASQPAAPDTAASTASPSDSMAEAGPPPVDVQLGTSIHLALWAQSDVSGIRIQRDDDLRRPYWIREGDVSVFPFQEQATIQGGLANVRVVVEGHPYPVQSQDTTEGLEITRSDVEAFVDTLRGDPMSFPASPDTIAIGQPTQ